ncbi:MAG: flippase-like domain-containing protein [Taibaiella sp.]|nr:flippase-like domain-containing protein [Taibaiella sp.]
MLNKSTKIWLNYGLGAAISALLLWSIYTQVMKQVSDASSVAWNHTGPVGFAILALVFMLFNSALEAYKWFSLVSWVEPVRYVRAVTSYLAGVAFSVITPNRIGEYPGRILYLGGSNTFSYINISVSGVVSQLAGMYTVGLLGLIYYNATAPAPIARLALVACITLNIFIAIVYWRFHSWLPRMEQSRVLRRFAVYGRLMARVPATDKLKVLGISVLRVCVFTAQYLFLLRWMNVDIPLLPGFCLGALFFWVMAVVPSLALTELGVRGAVSLYIFGQYSSNSVGILAATTAMWVMNIVVPAILGSILIIRMKWLR